MTKQQKAEILKLRSEGATFSVIADKLQLSINTVKSFYRRNEPEKAHCKYCNDIVNQTKGTREKKFCSDKCRMLWWNSHRNEVKRKATYRYICKYCGNSFEAYGNKQRKYCGRDCYIKHRFGGKYDAK